MKEYFCTQCAEETDSPILSDIGDNYANKMCPYCHGIGSLISRTHYLYFHHMAAWCGVPTVHDLRRDPSDLPDSARYVLVGYPLCDSILTTTGAYDCGKWLVEGVRHEVTVVGWQELPDWEASHER